MTRHYSDLFRNLMPPLEALPILGDLGADSGNEEKSKRAEKYMARRKVKNGKKSPWGQCLTRPVPHFSGTNQKPERRRPFGTGLVRHCPQGLFSPFFTFLCAIYFSARLDFSSFPLSAPGSPRMKHYPDLGGISALIFQTSFGKETSGSASPNVSCFLRLFESQSSLIFLKFFFHRLGCSVNHFFVYIALNVCKACL